MQAHPDSALAFQRRETRIFDEIDEATSGKDVWRYVHGTSYPAEVSVRNCEPRHAIRMTALGWLADVRGDWLPIPFGPTGEWPHAQIAVSFHRGINLGIP